MKNSIKIFLAALLAGFLSYSCQQDAHGVDPYVIEKKVDTDSSDTTTPVDNKQYLYADNYQAFVQEALSMDDNNPINSMVSTNVQKIKFDTTGGHLNLIIDGLVIENKTPESALFINRSDRMKKINLSIESESIEGDGIFGFMSKPTEGNYISVVMQRSGDNNKYELDGDKIFGSGMYMFKYNTGTVFQTLTLNIQIYIRDNSFDTKIIGLLLIVNFIY